MVVLALVARTAITPLAFMITRLRVPAANQRCRWPAGRKAMGCLAGVGNGLAARLPVCGRRRRRWRFVGLLVLVSLEPSGSTCRPAQMSF